MPLGTDLDARQGGDDGGWNASPSRRFERLLRETGVPIGLLSNGARIRLMYAPRGENSGSAAFTVKEMSEVAGRPILAAFHMLLDRYRLLAAPSEARLQALLARSRDYQSRVSTKLAQQVLDALYEMLRGFQGANERAGGELLRPALERRSDDIYAGLLTVLMRLVFLLFAEDRGLTPTSELADKPFVARPDLRACLSDEVDWDDRVADLQYRDVCEYAVGHGVSATAGKRPDQACFAVSASRDGQ